MQSHIYKRQIAEAIAQATQSLTASTQRVYNSHDAAEEVSVEVLQSIAQQQQAYNQQVKELAQQRSQAFRQAVAARLRR